MALFAKVEGLRRVPWFSSTEWHQVYKQIYSNDTTQQMKGYKTLLIWKARMPKLPVGVECTLSLIQVCLRDREWTPKIDRGEMPMYFKNDLSLLYSTTIMRFLNQISNIGHTKQTSLFQIAKQLRIPEWIVNLRHDAAHSHEFPDIVLLRIAANILLTWLHDEYWTAEGQSFEDQYTRESDIIETEDVESSQTLVDLIELWIAVGLYIEAGYNLVSDLPDQHLRNTLNELKIYATKSQDINTDFDIGSNYRLIMAQSYSLAEISSMLGRNKTTIDKKKIVINVLFNSEVFLPTSESLELFVNQSNNSDCSVTETSLPLAMTKFWQNFIHLMHEKKMLELLTSKLLEFVNSPNENRHRRIYAALWINSIAKSLIKLKIAQQNAQTLEHSHDEKDKRMTPKIIRRKLRAKIHNENPELDNALWLNVSEDIPTMFTDINFTREIACHPNELTIKFFGPLLDLVTPRMNDLNKRSLLQLVRIFTTNNIDDNTKNNVDDNTKNNDTIYTIDDIKKIIEDNKFAKDNSHGNEVQVEKIELADTKIRNSNWELAQPNCDWELCTFGVLPWQIDTLETLHSVDITPKSRCVDPMTCIIPGYVDPKHLSSSSQIHWEKILRKKQRTKRKKSKDDADIMMNKAIEMAKIKKI